MKARKMFEKLGYKYEKRYEDNTNIAYESNLTETRIVFHTNKYKGNRLHVYATGHNYQDSGMLSFAEIKAINKQIKELHWKDNTKEQKEWFRENKE